jgi:hypothetical protein
MKPGVAADILPTVVERALLGLGVGLLALGAFASASTVTSVWQLRKLRLPEPPAQRTAQEDEASHAYWLEFFATLSALAGGVLLVSGTGVLWLRSRWRS